jgi:hypothetical protein
MYRIIAIFVLLALAISCSDNQVEPEVDCAVEGPQLSVLATPSDCGQPTGSVTVTTTGGAAPFTYEIDAVGFEDNDTGIYLNMSAGNYEVTVTDANDCSATISAVVESAEGPVIDGVEITDSGCGNTRGTVTVSASGGEGELSFSLDGSTPGGGNIFSGLAPGSYQLIVSDEAGCETLAQVEVLSGVSLTDDIAPIIAANCAVSGCHDGSRSPNLTSNSGIIGSASRILARTSAGTMPPSGALSSNLVDQIECWVNDNAPDN